MNPGKHAATSVVVGIFFVTHLHSWAGAIACLISGVLIDVDHIIDYWLHKGKITIIYDELYEFCALQREGNAYLIFHSYEMLAALWVAISYFDLGAVWLGTAVGLTVHMIFDQFTNPVRPLVYFFGYRLKYKFLREFMFKEEYYKTLK